MNLIFREGFSFSGFERDALFLNLGGETFKDISGVSGLDSILDGRALVLADFDNDGDLDVFLTTIQGQGHQLFRNNVGQENSFVRVILEGTASGRDAFGAVVRLKTDHGIQTRIKSGGNGYMAQHDPRLLFGLGQLERAEWVEIRWPSGSVERFGPVRAGQTLSVRERDDREMMVTEAISKGTLPNPIGADERLWRKLTVGPGDRFPSLPVVELMRTDATEEVFQTEPGARYLLNFWASYCGPCRQEMPELEKLKGSLAEAGIRLIGIGLDTDFEAARNFAEMVGVTYPLYQTDPAHLEALFADAEILIPLSIVVDERGRADDAFAGWNAEKLERLKALIP